MLSSCTVSGASTPRRQDEESRIHATQKKTKEESQGSISQPSPTFSPTKEDQRHRNSSTISTRPGLQPAPNQTVQSLFLSPQHNSTFAPSKAPLTEAPPAATATSAATPTDTTSPAASPHYHSMPSDLESPIDSEFRFGVNPLAEAALCTGWAGGLHDAAGVEADNEESSPESSPSLFLNASRNPSLGLTTIDEHHRPSTNAIDEQHRKGDFPPSMEDAGRSIKSDAKVASAPGYGTFRNGGPLGESQGELYEPGVEAPPPAVRDEDGSEGSGSRASSARESENGWARDTAELVQSYQNSFAVSVPEKEERRSWRLLDGFRPAEFFKKLTVRDAKDEQATEMQEYSSNSSETSPITAHHAAIGRVHPSINRADKLPQSFVVRFLGKRPCNGLWGIRNTRRPTDELVMEAKNANGGQDAPALVIEVREDGVVVAAHRSNRNPAFDAGLIPIQNISYGVQDVRFTRVVAFIVVTDNVEANKTDCDCFVYLCDSKLTARKVAFALAKAFKEYGKRIQGAASFAVDLDLNGVMQCGTSAMTPGLTSMVPLEEADESKCDPSNATSGPESRRAPQEEGLSPAPPALDIGIRKTNVTPLLDSEA